MSLRTSSLLDKAAVALLGATASVAANLVADEFGWAAMSWTVPASAALAAIIWLRRLHPRAPLVRYVSRLFLATSAAALGLALVAPSGWRFTLIVISVVSATVALLVRNLPLRDLVYSAQSGVRSGGDLLSRGLTGLAVGLAGRRRASDAEAWRAHLLGRIGSEHPLTPWRQLRIALGFLLAAVRMRWRDACRQLCRPCDWLVTQESRIAKLLVLVGFVAVASLCRVGGWARVWDDFEQVGVLLGLVSGAAYGWRKLRGIESPPRELRRRGEDA